MSTTEGRTDDYDAHSQYQRAVTDTAAELIAQSVDAVPLSSGVAFVVADYGSSTGANSVAAVRTAIETARGHDAARPVVALHNDLPTNDWNQLFRNLATSPDSYLQLAGPRVLPLASAVSFFLPAAPTGSVHLGVSFAAAHWLREQPKVAVPNGFYFCEATGMANDGIVDRGAVRHYVLPVYARTVDEARAPLARVDSPVHDAFTVIECRTDPVANPYFTKWRADHDNAAYARAYPAFVRGFTESSLREHLFVPDATNTDVDAAVDEFFTRLTARFEADPERDRFDDWTLTVVLARN
jgi:hypothetical protein